MVRVAVLMLVLTAVAPARGQEPENRGRYAFVPVPEGALRLNTQTGEVSLCSGEGVALACKLVPDTEAAPPAGAGEASGRIAALEARVAALEARPVVGDILPDEEALDRVAVLADKVMRRFFGLVREMKRELEDEEL
ncbi:MAG: hypothetical protein M3453_04635 [Pseudomonadota bacterium]|nr:hypothetical protein [Pseudomonadota bacterium]